MSDSPFPTNCWHGPFDLRDFMDPGTRSATSSHSAAIEQGGVYAWYDREKQEFAYFGRSYSNIRKRQLQHLAAQAGLVQSHDYGTKHADRWSINWGEPEVRNAYWHVDRFVQQVRHAFAYIDAIDIWAFPMAEDREDIKNAEKLLLATFKPYGTNTMGAPNVDLGDLQAALLEIGKIAPETQRKRQ